MTKHKCTNVWTHFIVNFDRKILPFLMLRCYCFFFKYCIQIYSFWHVFSVNLQSNCRSNYHFYLYCTKCFCRNVQYPIWINYELDRDIHWRNNTLYTIDNRLWSHLLKHCKHLTIILLKDNKLLLKLFAIFINFHRVTKFRKLDKIYNQK